MRSLVLASLTAAVFIPATAQEWELGGVGSYGFSRGLAAYAPVGTATTGFASGYAWGVLAGHNPHRLVGGEIRYAFRRGDLRVERGGQKATMRGHAHLVHYDVVVHAADRGAWVRPFFAVGGGARAFRGTGLERAVQPLSQFVLLTRTHQTLPVLSVGGGVKIRVSRWLSFRLEARDYVSPAPDKLLTPAPGAEIRGWLHDVVPAFGLTVTLR
ncbi:MAG: hypothetical protein RMK57_05185 [Bryobacterales bacterium]|nr:hypothetical protein [Bryobacteraceae bacterium]MDW8353908.1 hypothetical protein [Bryobacterales bacterium]